MSDYHNRIMNIATEPGIEELERGDRLLYKYGHQVARHAAAEIAAEAEQEITRLQSENEALRARVAELESDIFSACAEVLEREAEAIGSKQGLGRRMARLRIACLAQRLRDQDAALAAHRKQEPSHDNQ